MNREYKKRTKKQVQEIRYCGEQIHSKKSKGKTNG